MNLTESTGFIMTLARLNLSTIQALQAVTECTERYYDIFS